MRITKSHEDNAGQAFGFDFDNGTGLFRGTAKNTSTGLICDSHTEIHLGAAMGVAELGPGQWLGGVPYADELGARLKPDRRQRFDRTRTFTVSVLNRAVTLFRFSPQLALIHEARLTNAQAQDYERNRAELRFVRQF